MAHELIAQVAKGTSDSQARFWIVAACMPNVNTIRSATKSGEENFVVTSFARLRRFIYSVGSRGFKF